MTKKNIAAQQAAFSMWGLASPYGELWSPMQMGMQMGGGPKQKASGDWQPKGELHNGFQLLVGRTSTKDDIVYECEESDGKYVAVVKIPELGEVCQGKPAASKKEAERDAAQKLLNQLQEQINEKKGSRPGAKGMNMQMGMQMGGGPKQTASGDWGPKAELHSGAQLLLGRTSAKGDIVYESEESDGKYVAVVTIPELGKQCKSKPVDSKKEAERDAAQKLLNQLKKQINEKRGSRPGGARKMQMGMQMGGGPKQKASGDWQPKGELHNGFQLLVGRTSTKDDIVYECEESDGKYVAVVKIPELGKVCQGKPADSKKEAEREAAQKLLNQVKKELDEAKATQAVAKKAKAEASFDRLKRKWEARNAGNTSE